MSKQIFIKRLGLLFGLLVLNVNAEDRLKFPYYSWGACLAKCALTGNSYNITGITKAYKRPNTKSPIVFEIKADENVKLLELAEVVTKPIVVRVNNSNNECNFPKGATVYGLSYLAEGYYNYWYKGRIYECNLNEDEKGYDAKIITDGEYFVWGKVKNKAGKIGWILEQESTHGLFSSQN